MTTRFESARIVELEWTPNGWQPKAFYRLSFELLTANFDSSERHVILNVLRRIASGKWHLRPEATPRERWPFRINRLPMPSLVLH